MQLFCRIPFLVSIAAFSGAVSATLPNPPAEPAPTPRAAESDDIMDLPENATANLDTITRALVERGRYVALLGRCVACHSGDRAQPLAGGLALKTPFGELHSTNITPDPETGIGRYSFEQFDRAVRKGVAADGRPLHPAMPYPSFVKITEADIQCLYTYLMKAVAPVRRANRPADLGFPFGGRWGLSLWNRLFFDDTPFKPDPMRSPAWNRGAYIVQGPGHCGACHTPRGLGGQEKALSAEGSDGRYFLAGETAEDRRAPSLRDPWEAQAMAEWLKTGGDARGAVDAKTDARLDAERHGTRHLSDGDRLSIGLYLQSLPAGTRAGARD